MRVIVNIDVPVLVPAIEFYTAALGFEVSRILDDDVAELVGATSTIYLLQKPAGSAFSNASDGVRRYDKHWTPVHVDFVVEDIAAATERAEKAGAVRESECVSWRGSNCITFSDPFGNGFCLIEFSEETYRDTHEQASR